MKSVKNRVKNRFGSWSGLNEKDSSDWSVLHHAAWCGLKEVCGGILERRDFTEADAQDISGLTALHCAACKGHLGAALVLLATKEFTAIGSAEAQIDRNGVGWSARDIAERYGHRHIVEAIDDADRRKAASLRYSMICKYDTIF